MNNLPREQVAILAAKGYTVPAAFAVKPGRPPGSQSQIKPLIAEPRQDESTIKIRRNLGLTDEGTLKPPPGKPSMSHGEQSNKRRFRFLESNIDAVKGSAVALPADAPARVILRNLGLLK